MRFPDISFFYFDSMEQVKLILFENSSFYRREKT